MCYTLPQLAGNSKQYPLPLFRQRDTAGRGGGCGVARQHRCHHGIGDGTPIG